MEFDSRKVSAENMKKEKKACILVYKSIIFIKEHILPLL